MRRLWGRANSVNVQKALWGLDEAGLAYERIEAGGAHGVVSDPTYRALNPNGLVPLLEEDGFALWESNAILRYLADGAAGALRLPEDRRERAQVQQWLDWQATSFTPAMRDAFLQLYRATPGNRDHALIAASIRDSETLAAILDRHLEGRDWVVGTRFSIADIALGCAVHRWFALPTERVERSAMRRWYATLARRPAAMRVFAEPIS